MAGGKYKSEESKARESAHWFGSKNGNTIFQQSVATNQREFYRWCETKATTEELKAYANDESKPAARRMFVRSLLKCDKVQDFFDLTNQTHGKPKEYVEVTTDAETAAAIREEWSARYGTDKG